MKNMASIWTGAVVLTLGGPAFAVDGTDDSSGHLAGWTEADEPSTTSPDPEADRAPVPAPVVVPHPKNPGTDGGEGSLHQGWRLSKPGSVASVGDQGSEEPTIKPDVKRAQHGFRMGYLYIANYDEPVDEEGTDCPNCSLKRRYDLKSPHQFLLGYEAMARIVGHDWLNVILVGNVMVSGLEQSKFLPSANFLVGFEVDESFQLGVGTNVTFEETKPIHMVVAAGWTAKVGSFQVPVHAFFIPDVDRNHRLGMTLGVNW